MARILPGCCRSSVMKQIAVRLAWDVLHDLDKPSHWHICDGAEMLTRVSPINLTHGSRADRVLPDL